MTTRTRISRSEASTYLLERHGISRTPGTLAKLAVVGGGPAFRKVGQRHVLYDLIELDRWAESILSEPMASTSESARKLAWSIRRARANKTPAS